MKNYEEKKQKFENFLSNYYGSKACLTKCARAAKLSPDTASRWFDKWSKGLLFQEIPKPKIEDSTEISRLRYL